MLIMVPSQAHPSAIALHVTPGCTKHCPFAEHPSETGNPQISRGPQSEEVEHGAPASTVPPVPELATPELAIPELTLPEPPVPELDFPEPPVPELAIPEVALPEAPLEAVPLLAPVPELPAPLDTAPVDADPLASPVETPVPEPGV
jgi:hypothetical protein